MQKPVYRIASPLGSLLKSGSAFRSPHGNHLAKFFPADVRLSFHCRGERRFLGYAPCRMDEKIKSRVRLWLRSERAFGLQQIGRPGDGPALVAVEESASVDA